MRIRIVNEAGETTTRSVSGKRFVIEDTDGNSLFTPDLTQAVKPDIKGNTNVITINCGETEVRRNGHTNINLTVEGLLTEKNLPSFYRIGERDGPIRVNTPVLGDRSGLFVVESVNLKDTSDLVSYQVLGEDGAEDAFNFMMQLKRPGSNASGG